ncbi:MAG: hypothetical protein ACREUE_17475, partial [Panacagrimonas sp.]
LATQSGDGEMVTNKGEKLKGWVDIDLYLNGMPKAMPMPDWLPGWWKVPWRADTFYYYFEKPGSVKWTLKKPISDAMAPVNFNDTANVMFNDRGELTLQWWATQTIENFKKQADKIMIGDWNSKEPLIATRCF